MSSSIIKCEYLKFNKSENKTTANENSKNPKPAQKHDFQDDEAENTSDNKNLKKQRGNNKNRVVKYSQDEIKLCNSIESCKKGTDCKFSHDTAAYMKTKGADLGPTCHNFETLGFCKFGLQCRYATTHINEKFENIKNDVLYQTTKNNVLNIVDRDFQKAVRSKQIKFPRTDAFYKEFEIKKKALAVIEEEKRAIYLSKKTSEATSNEKKLTGIENEKDDITSGLNHSAVFYDGQERAVPLLSTDNIDFPESTAHMTVQSSVCTEFCDVPAPQKKNESVLTSLTGSLEHGKGESTASHAVNIIKKEDLETNIKLTTREKKKIDFRGKTYLAPLTTVGNLPFRRICKGFGVDITCGEMAVSHNLLAGQQSEWALMRRHKSENIFGVQICGPSPYLMTKTAEMIGQSCDVDFIDINSGCPIDAIFKTGAGSALLDRTPKLVEMLSGMSAVVDCPLTLKIRTGVNDTKPTAHKLIPRFQDLGVGLITLHGRSRQQRYTKLADWSYIDEVAKLSPKIPMFGNGDIMCQEEYYQHLEESSISGAMIGRGALIKPWIFTEIKERKVWDISSGERLDMLKDFANNGLEQWGSDTMGLNQTRRFMCEWLSFLCRYVPVGLLEVTPQRMNDRPPPFIGRNDLETLMGSPLSTDWIKITELILGPAPKDFDFIPK